MISLLLFSLLLNGSIYSNAPASTLAVLNDQVIISGDFKVKVKEVNRSGKVEKLKGTVSLNENEIWSDFSELNGFSTAQLEVKPNPSSPDILFFNGQSTHESGAILTWTGQLKANHIQGKASRDDTGTVYYFKGKN